MIQAAACPFKGDLVDSPRKQDFSHTPSDCNSCMFGIWKFV